MEDIKKTIGNNINSLLATQGRKQKEPAKELGVTDNTISYFCAGKRSPNFAQLVRIADYFDVSVDTLLSRNRAQSENDMLALCCSYTGLSAKAVKNLSECAPDVLCSLLEGDDFADLMDEIDSLEIRVTFCKKAIEETNKAIDENVKFWGGYPGLDESVNVDHGEWQARAVFSDFKSDFANMRLTFKDIEDAFAGIIERLTGITDVIAAGKELLRAEEEKIYGERS
jgi:transcriptional regulator with XRE-family HTH domain